MERVGRLTLIYGPDAQIIIAVHRKWFQSVLPGIVLTRRANSAEGSLRGDKRAALSAEDMHGLFLAENSTLQRVVQRSGRWLQILSIPSI